MAERATRTAHNAGVAHEVEKVIERRERMRIDAGEATAQEALEAFWKAGEERKRQEEQAENRRLWIAHYEQLAENHHKLAEAYGARAEQLLGGGL